MFKHRQNTHTKMPKFWLSYSLYLIWPQEMSWKVQEESLELRCAAFRQNTWVSPRFHLASCIRSSARTGLWGCSCRASFRGDRDVFAGREEGKSCMKYDLSIWNWAFLLECLISKLSQVWKNGLRLSGGKFSLIPQTSLNPQGCDQLRERPCSCKLARQAISQSTCTSVIHQIPPHCTGSMSQLHCQTLLLQGTKSWGWKMSFSVTGLSQVHEGRKVPVSLSWAAVGLHYYCLQCVYKCTFSLAEHWNFLCIDFYFSSPDVFISRSISVLCFGFCQIDVSSMKQNAHIFVCLYQIHAQTCLKCCCELLLCVIF